MTLTWACHTVGAGLCTATEALLLLSEATRIWRQRLTPQALQSVLGPAPQDSVGQPWSTGSGARLLGQKATRRLAHLLGLPATEESCWSHTGSMPSPPGSSLTSDPEDLPTVQQALGGKPASARSFGAVKSSLGNGTSAVGRW